MADAFDSLRPALDLVASWAGASRAILVGGSHATGEAVWADVGERRVSLSDLDVYAVLPSARACREAAGRARAARPGLAPRLLAMGLAAPLEVGWFTSAALAALPARPGSIALTRHARVVSGDPGVLAVLPRWSARDVGGEELTLLIENRAFELLLARGELAAPDRLLRLRARHATLKSAIDLAAAITLETGEFPDGAAAVVARARALAAASGSRDADLEACWDAALAWRSAVSPEPLEAEAARLEWRRVALGWASAWRRRARALPGTGGGDDGTLALRMARRARWRRRVRLALRPESRGRAPALASRLRHALVGTPQHRVNAAAAALVIAGAEGATDALPPATTAVLEALGIVEGGPARHWDDAVAAVTGAWDAWVLDGQRTVRKEVA